MITLIIAYFVICMIMGVGKMCIEELQEKAARRKRIKELTKYYQSEEYKLQQKKEREQKRLEEERKNRQEEAKRRQEIENKRLEQKIHHSFGGTVEIDDVEYEVKINRYCEYEFVPKKKSDIAILCEEYEKLKKQKEQLEEKKQLEIDRTGVQLTIDDWTKQQAKDKERQEAIDVIKNKDGQLSFFNEITEEQIQKQIIENKRKHFQEILEKAKRCRKETEELLEKISKANELDL